MQWLDRIVHTFIMTFGITEPSPEKRRVANLIIGLLLLVVILGFLSLIFFGIRHLAR
jgi:glycerol uptake facilitator-like aquaporin